jgi:hypothetical protein
MQKPNATDIRSLDPWRLVFMFKNHLAPFVDGGAGYISEIAGLPEEVGAAAHTQNLNVLGVRNLRYFLIAGLLHPGSERLGSLAAFG